MKRVFVKSIAVILASSFFHTVYAAPQWYLAFGAGFARTELDSKSLIDNNAGASLPYNLDTYTSNNSNGPALLLEIGKRWSIYETRLKALALGLQYQYIFPIDVGNDVFQYSSPDFLNYRYRLNMSANILLLNAKLELFTCQKLTPFINAGVGALQLIANDYSETALPGVTARISPDFNRNATYNLTYQAGAGISWELNKALSVSLNYIYRPLAHFTTKQGKGTWSDEKLDFGDAYAHTLFIMVIFDS